jgi:glucan-binding YG repeat protein
MKYVNGVQEQNGVLYYFEKGVKTHAGIIKIDGEIYYAGTGGIIVTNTTKLVYSGYTNGLVPPGTYEFDAEGKMKYANGIHEIDGILYYFVDAVKTHAGVIQIGDDYYYAATGGVIVRNTSKFVYFGYANGLVAPGEYEFDADGKMIINK